MPIRSSRFLTLTAPLLLVVGVQCWLVILHGYWGTTAQPQWLGIALIIALIPPIRRIIWKTLKPLNHPNPRKRFTTTISIAIFATAYFILQAQRSGRDLFPIMHDEFQFLLQARMFASGHPWQPPLPLPEFFDTFYVLVTPHYAAQSFPGTAILYVPALWLHIPPWLWTTFLSGITVALMYRVTAELTNGVTGFLAAGFLAAVPMMQFASTKVLGQTPVILLGLAAILAWLYWRKKTTFPRAIVIGIFLGLLAITRPVDAIIFALPILIAMASRWKHFPAILLGASPFILFQLSLNYGITGHPFQTPMDLYNQRDQPQLTYGFTPVGDDRPPITTVPEKQNFYAHSVLPDIRAHTLDNVIHELVDSPQERLQTSLEFALGQPLLLALFPAGLLAILRRKRWILIAPLPLFFILYAPYPIFNQHYPLIIAPAAIALSIFGLVAINGAFPRIRRAIYAFATIFVLSLLALPGWYPQRLMWTNTTLESINNTLIRLNGQPSLVLFKRDPRLTPEIEPVYNLDAPWPDDSPLIRAHDRGPDNARLFQYYAKIDPTRPVYLFDESNTQNPLTSLGTVAELAHHAASATSRIGAAGTPSG